MTHSPDALLPHKIRPGITPGVILLALFVLSLPFFSIWDRAGLVRPDWIVGGLLIASFLFRMLLRPRMTVNRVGWWVLLLNLAAVMSLVSLFNAGPAQTREFATMWAQLIFASVLFFAISNVKVSASQLQMIMKVWVLGAFLVALYGIYQALARNMDLPFAYVPLLNPSSSQLPAGLGFGEYVRPSSILSEPSYLGSYLIAPFLLMAIVSFCGRDRDLLFKKRLFNRMVLFTLMAGLVLSFSLSTYVTLTGVLFIALWDRRVRAFFITKGTVVLMAVVVMVLITQVLGVNFLSATERLERITQTVIGRDMAQGAGDGSASVRLTEATIALRVWASNPITGVGLNSVEFAAQEHAPDAPERIVAQGYVHNMWLQALAEMGIVGFVALAGLYGSALVLMRRACGRGDDLKNALALAFFYVLLASVIGGMMTGTPIHIHNWLYLGLASLVYSASRVKRENVMSSQGSDHDNGLGYDQQRELAPS